MFGPLEAMLAGGGGVRIARVLVGAGPGSYSGTRVGIAVAQGIAIARGCPAVAVPSIVAVDTSGQDALAIGDARRGHWWWAAIDAGRMAAAAPELGDREAFQRAVEVADADGRVIFSFDPPESFGVEVAVEQKRPLASLLWQAWRDASAVCREAWAAAPPQPCYLKPPHITAPKRPWLVG